MNKNIVIVESPAKAKTINKYLGNDFKVIASYGHVRDLIPKEGAVDTRNFSMKYEIIEKNKKYIKAICDAVKDAKVVYLATDPDREGEAISWHVCEILKDKDLLDSKPVRRVIFYEITKSAIQEAISTPRHLSTPLVNAQQARRALDYLVGFNLSPLLWKKIKRGLSAGRVQSPALRMIVERELEIEAFKAQEYWSVEADLEKDSHAFMARLIHYEGKKVAQFTITDKTQAQQIHDTLLKAANGNLTVVSVEKKNRKKNPSAPFITSTLQQEASRKLGFSAQRTMRIAQQLYEGVDVGNGAVGLITYMRTDSVNLSREAITEVRELIQQRYGKEMIPEKPHLYKTKIKNAQEAHEAIRPTSVKHTPESLKSYLNQDQYNLYDIIWKRTVASQMIPATIHMVTVDLACGDSHMFRANGSSIAQKGYMAVYQEGSDDKQNDNDEKLLPNLKKGETVNLLEIRTEQHFTKPPPRYSEASLIKSLEEFGIGRPSTYAAIISTLLAREYAELESRRFLPTDMGRIVNRFLTDHFEKYVDYQFTAQMEDHLDAISRGEREWKPVMQDFWLPFYEQVEEKTQIPRDQLIMDRILGIDPRSGRPVSVRMAKFGPVVQIGTKDDPEKPLFAGLKPGQSMEKIGLEEALKLFELPRALGETPEGEDVSVSIGRYGPYVRYGNKFVSLKTDDPYTVRLERALEIIHEKKIADANKILQSFTDSPVQILRGRYGPYITNGQKNVRVPKDSDPQTLTLEACLELLEKAPEKGKRGAKKSTAKKSNNPKNTTAKSTAKKNTTKKSTAKKSTAKKSTAKKNTTKKSTAKKSTAKKNTAKSAAQKISQP